VRAGPLSNKKVITLLNRYFVPVYSSNQDVAPTGSAPPEEKAERNRIYSEFYNKKLGVGDVHVYILSPDGHAFDGLTIGSATQTGPMTELLERTIQKLKTVPGDPVVKPRPQSTPPSHQSDEMVLHLTARGFNKGSWREFPAENWIVLNRAEWNTLLPGGAVQVGSSWEFGKPVTNKLLANFYPQMEETSDADRSRIEQAMLKAAVVSIERGVARARIDGNLRMKRSWSPNPAKQDNSSTILATLLGFVDFEPGTRRIQTLRLVTDKATYGSADSKEQFGVALRSMSPEKTPD
jgi:hypothetical protein